MPAVPEPFLGRDSLGMCEAAIALPRDLVSALDEAPPATLPESVSAVAVLGMGGSAVAGAVLEAFGRDRCPVPVVVVDGYEAPGFVGRESLVVAVSFSGETEETLAATEQCLAKRAPVVAITSGGALAELVSAAGGTVIPLPPGIPQPRAGIGAMTARLLLLAEAAGLLPGARRELAAAVEQLDRRMPSLQTGGGLALEVARRIEGTIALVHGASGLGAVAARRWKTQLNENAKVPAFFGVEPEVCHNEVCGFGELGDVTRQLFSLVSVRLPVEHPQVARRFDLVGEWLDEAVADVVEVRGEGEGALAAFFDLVAIGDFVSMHAAAWSDVDPGPVPVLADIKARLRAE
jgi:glucose/mannose-6-phosphate isomerase